VAARTRDGWGVCAREISQAKYLRAVRPTLEHFPVRDPPGARAPSPSTRVEGDSRIWSAIAVTLAPMTLALSPRAMGGRQSQGNV